MLDSDRALAKAGATATTWVRRGLPACLAGISAAAFAHAPSNDLLNLDFDQLTEIMVSEASGFEQAPWDAPVNVTVITRENIRDFGWLTLGDALGSLAGLFARNDRNYDYLGTPLPGDYNSRYLLLIDGVRATDGIYNQALTGHTALIGLESVERIEYIAGPGSSLHGGNAYYGTINVVTVSGRDGGEAGFQVGSLGVARGYASMHEHLGRAQISVSGSRYKRSGDDVYYPEFDTPDQNRGVATGLDGETDENIYLRLAQGGTQLQLAYSDRHRDVSTASYEQAFNQPGSWTQDQSLLLSLKHDRQLGSATDLGVEASLNRYRYTGHYVYGASEDDLSVDVSKSLSVRLAGRIRHELSAQLRLLAGLDWQRDTELLQQNLTPSTREFFLNRNDQREHAGLYLAGEWQPTERVTSHLGLRLDDDSISGSQFSPRLGVSVRFNDAVTAKLGLAQAYRPPNAYELYYEVPGEGGSRANPTLRSERIRTSEFSLNLRPAGRFQYRFYGYYATLSDLLVQVPIPTTGELIFVNGGTAHVTGLTSDVTASFDSGATLRVGLAYTGYHMHHELVETETVTLSAINTNLTVPLLDHRVIAGVEGRYMAPIQGWRGESDAFGLVHLNLRAPNLPFGLEASLRIANLLDTDYGYVGGPEHLQTTLPQDGRSLLFGLRMDW